MVYKRLYLRSLLVKQVTEGQVFTQKAKVSHTLRALLRNVALAPPQTGAFLLFTPRIPSPAKLIPGECKLPTYHAQ